MDFEFKRLDFSEMFLIRKYGEEIFEIVERNTSNGRSIIDVEMNDEELKRLIKSIPASISGEIDKNIEDDMPITLSMLDKILNNKIVSFFTPNALSRKVDKKIVEAKDNCQNNNSIELFNTIMSNIDSIRFKMEDEYNNTESIVNSLESSKKELADLIQKFDIVIETGIQDIEDYQNSDIEDPMKEKKVNMANQRILSLREARAEYSSFIQQKDLVAYDYLMYLIKLEDWLRINYHSLSYSVEGAIEAKYINNKSKQLQSLIDTSNSVKLDGAKLLKEASEINVQLLKGGSIDHDAMNKYLKSVNEALAPIEGFIADKGANIKKLMSDMDKMEETINNNRKKLESICTSQTIPVIETAQPKILRLEKNSKYE